LVVMTGVPKMIQGDRLAAVRCAVSDLSQAQVTAALCLSKLKELVAVDAPPCRYPRVDGSKFSFRWGRATSAT
jgi:hypothetical protein